MATASPGPGGHRLAERRLASPAGGLRIPHATRLAGQPARRRAPNLAGATHHGAGRGVLILEAGYSTLLTAGAGTDRGGGVLTSGAGY